MPPGGEGGSAGQAGQSSTAGHAGEAGSLPSPCDPITLECPDGGACTCYQSGPIQSSCYCSTPCEGADDCAPEEHCGGCEPTLLCLPEDAPTECCGCRCAAPDTPIATPDGERPIASLKPGDLVMSLDAGRLVAVPILATRRVPQSGHFVVEARLEDGRRLEISGGHPTADGRRFDQLAPGDRLGDARVLSVQTIPYRHPFTHDILPDSDSGTYLAAGALVGSTLAEERR